MVIHYLMKVRWDWCGTGTFIYLFFWCKQSWYNSLAFYVFFLFWYFLVKTIVALWCTDSNFLEASYSGSLGTSNIFWLLCNHLKPFFERGLYLLYPFCKLTFFLLIILKLSWREMFFTLYPVAVSKFIFVIILFLIHN